MNKKRSCGCVALMIAASFCTIAVIGFLVWWTSSIRSVARQLPAQRAAAKRLGLPLTPDELRRHPPVPPARNAAVIWTTILALPPSDWPTNFENDVLLSIVGLDGSSGDWANAGRILRKYSKLLRLANQAAARPECDFQSKWELGPLMPLLHTSAGRHLTWLLCADAAVAAKSGDPEHAMRSVATAARIGRQSGQEDELIGFLASLSCESIVHSTFVAIVEDHPNDPMLLAAARRAETAFNPPFDLRTYLQQDLVVSLVLNEQMRNGTYSGGNAPPFVLKLLGLDNEFLADAFESRQFETWNALFVVLSKGNYDLVEQRRQLTDLSNRKQAAAGLRCMDITYFMSDMMSPIYSSLSVKLMQNEAERRLREVMLALFEYRLKHRGFPNALSDLPTAPPLDPFDNQQLRYKLTPKGFLLYSIGRDFKDDGGKVTPPKGSYIPPDMVIAYPPVKPPTRPPRPKANAPRPLIVGE
jgi:hypothetical protein